MRELRSKKFELSKMYNKKIVYSMCVVVYVVDVSNT